MEEKMRETPEGKAKLEKAKERLDAEMAERVDKNWSTQPRGGSDREGVNPKPEPHRRQGAPPRLRRPLRHMATPR